MIRYVAAVLVLTLVYVLTLSSLNPWDIAAGVVISSALLFTANRRFGGGLGPSGEAGGDRPGLRISFGRVLAFFPFALAVLRDSLNGSWRVIKLTLGIEPAREPGMVAVPLGDRSPEGIAVSAFVAAFSPGTLLVRVDEEAGVMWVHAIDAGNPEEVCRQQSDLYENFQKKVFP